MLPESSGIQHGSRGIVPSSPQPSRHGVLEVTGVRGPRPSCVSALYTTLPTAPGLFSDPFLHFPHNSSCEQRRSCGPGAVLLLCVHGLIYFPQICKVGMTPVPFLHKIWWGLERLSHTPKVTQLLSGKTKVPAQLCLLQSPFPNCLLPHSHGDSLLSSTYPVSMPRPSSPCLLDSQPRSHADISASPRPTPTFPLVTCFPGGPPSACLFPASPHFSVPPRVCPEAGCPQRVPEAPHEAPRPAAQTEEGLGWGLWVSHSGVSPPHPVPEVEQVSHGGGGPLGPRGAGDLGLGSWPGTCPTWPA